MESRLRRQQVLINMVGDQERCLQAGMDGYVSKPIDIGQLLAEIRRVQATLRT